MNEPNSRDAGNIQTGRSSGLTTPATDARIARLSRRCARIVLELRREGHADGAARFEAASIEAVELVRAGRL